MTHKIACALCALLLGACAAPRAPVAACPPAAIPQDAALNELLNYQAGLRQLSQAELGKALLELGKQHGTASVTVRRAMLLAALRGGGDLARAQAQLEALAQSAAPEAQALKPLVQFLAAGYAEARRQDEALERLNQQVRDGQRRSGQLGDKLEALKNIERTLSAPVPVPVPAAPLK